jgi:hypothetical protein
MGRSWSGAGTNPARCHSCDAPAEIRGMAVAASAIQALRSSPKVSAREAAMGPSTTQAASAASSGRRGTRRASRGNIAAAAAITVAANTFAGVA